MHDESIVLMERRVLWDLGQEEEVDNLFDSQAHILIVHFQNLPGVSDADADSRFRGIPV